MSDDAPKEGAPHQPSPGAKSKGNGIILETVEVLLGFKKVVPEFTNWLPSTQTPPYWDSYIYNYTTQMSIFITVLQTSKQLRGAASASSYVVAAAVVLIIIVIIIINVPSAVMEPT